MSTETPTPAAIGATVRDLRGNLSQVALADAMRARGFEWFQSTVWKIEAGQRSVKLAEGLVLAEVLATDVYTLVGGISEEDTQARAADLATLMGQSVRDQIAVLLGLPGDAS